MRNLLLMLILLTSVISNAQNVAINNDASLPDNSAILDIKSDTKGLLIPRMNTASIAAIVSPAKGLLVLDTVKNQLLVNIGTPSLPNWQTIVASSGWGLLGNSGIDSATNFIGTLNTKPLIMRVNNVRAGYLDTITNNTSFGFRALDSSSIGKWNTAIGYKSLSATITGNNNTSIGFASLSNNQHGYSNVAMGTHALFNSGNRNNLVAIGDSALFNNGNGSNANWHATQNTAIGSKALFSNTSGFGNTGAGYKAMFWNTSGASNTAFGNGSLYFNSTGDYNTSAGEGSLFNNFSGSRNSSFGAYSLYNNESGNSNIAIGFYSLQNNRSGFSNVAIGAGALFSANHRSNLVAIGDSALFNNGNGFFFPTDGAGHTAVGSKALFSNTFGANNTAIGLKALYSNSTGSNLVAVGDSSLYKNTNGIENTAIGSKALYENSEGFGNTAIGFRALVVNFDGWQNTASGTNALRLNTSGAYNSGFGSRSLQSNSVGHSNSAFGELSLANNTTGRYNTTMGVNSLNANVDGTFNTSLGANSGTGSGDLTHATAIGARARVDCSNCLVLGSIDGVNGAFSNVNVGIGTTIPDAPLTFGNNIGKKIVLYNSGPSNQYGIGVVSALMQIHSDAAIADIAFGYGSSDSFTERMRIKGNGNVGIGTTNPTKPLSFPPSLGEKILLYPGAVGEVGIGVYGNELRLHADNPGAKVSFGTQDNAGVFTENAKAERNGIFAFSIFGNLWVNGTNYPSDERFKQNITSIESPLQKILQINGVEYEMKSGEFSQSHFIQGRQIGLLAQNVEKVVPEAVNERDGYKAVDYAKLVPLLIEGIKELQKQIEASNEEVRQLRQKQIETSNDEVKQLKQELAELKKMVEQLIKK